MDVTHSEALLQMFEYLSRRSLSETANPTHALVYGRHDLRVAQAAVKVMPQLRRSVVFTGGVGGKDGGILNEFGIPESHYLAAVANDLGMPRGCIHTESAATNGGENSRLGLDTILGLDQDCTGIVAVAHATSLRRLAETLITVIEDRGLRIYVHRFPSAYPFSPDNPLDTKEAVAEILRLADWPGKGDGENGRWLRPQPNLPAHLVEWARELQAEGW